jgi:agmatine deiminase
MIPVPNSFYFSQLLPERQPRLWQELSAALAQHSLTPQLLPNTRDIWAVDYMPVQVAATDFVQFRYEPGYLLPYAKYRPSISDPTATGMPQQLPSVLTSTLRLDGGNVVRAGELVLVCDKVLAENPTVPEQQIRRQLRDELQADRLLLLPTAPGDVVGHADAMVYLLDEHTALVNDYQGAEAAFGRSLRRELRNAGLECLPFPYNPYANRSTHSAIGLYLNFVKLPGLVLLPAFDLPDDEAARQQAQALFPDCQVVALPCAELATLGGVLHCITWAWHNLEI